MDTTTRYFGGQSYHTVTDFCFNIGDTAVVTGWGTPYYGGSIMNELQEVKVPIVSNESCQQYYSK